MPTKLDDYNFNSGSSRHDWDTLLNGDIYRVDVDELTSQPRSFVTSVQSAAKKRGLKAMTHLEKNGDTVTAVILQAVPA